MADDSRAIVEFQRGFSGIEIENEQFRKAQKLFRTKQKRPKRDALDRYYTPEPAIDALLKHAPEVRGGLLLDPSCGDGRMGRMLLAADRFHSIFSNDLDESVASDSKRDAALATSWDAWPVADWIVTNPPWCAASEIVRLAVQRARAGVAMLLRCTFLEPVRDRTWLRELPPARLLCLGRMSFRPGGHDFAPAWWVLWNFKPTTVLPPIVVVPKQRKARHPRTSAQLALQLDDERPDTLRSYAHG